MLALLFWQMNGMDEGLDRLKELKERCGRDIRIQLCPDDPVLDQCDTAKIASQSGIDDWISLDHAEKEKEKVDYFYIPFLSFSAVSDLLRFNDAQKATRLLLWALMRGKQVSAYTAGADPYHGGWKAAGLDNGTPFLKHEMQRQLQKLGGFGIRLLKHPSEILAYFLHSIRHEEKQIITAETIKKQAEAGLRYIEVKAGTVITPLARDVAQEFQIKINEKRAGEINGYGNRSRQGNGDKKR